MKKLGQRFLQALESMFDIMLVGFCFVLCSIPVITVGASATAMHYALRRCHDKSGSVAKDFFSAFKVNFRQATVVWLILLAAGAALLCNYWLLQEWQSELTPVVRVAMGIMCVLVLAETVMVFPMIARFENSVAALMRNSLLLALLHPVRALALMALTALPVVLGWHLPELVPVVAAFWMLGLGGGSAYLAQRILIPVYDKIESAVQPQEGM